MAQSIKLRNKYQTSLYQNMKQLHLSDTKRYDENTDPIKLRENVQL